MSLSENHDVDLLTAVLSLADPDDDRHVRRIQTLGERLSTYMESREHHVSGELSAMGDDLLTIMRTMAALGQRVQELEAIDLHQRPTPPTPEQPAHIQERAVQNDDIDTLNQHIQEQDQQIQSLSRTVADQAERIQGLSATVVELMDRIQVMESRSD